MFFLLIFLFLKRSGYFAEKYGFNAIFLFSGGRVSTSIYPSTNFKKVFETYPLRLKNSDLEKAFNPSLV
jgi:hypothetical protein